MVRCVFDYAKNTIVDIKAKCKDVHKCSRRLVKLHTY